MPATMPLSSTDPIPLDRGSNPGRCGRKWANNRPSYGTRYVLRPTNLFWRMIVLPRTSRCHQQLHDNFLHRRTSDISYLLALGNLFRHSQFINSFCRFHVPSMSPTFSEPLIVSLYLRLSSILLFEPHKNENSLYKTALGFVERDARMES
jgi:hypothetical protein